MVVLSKTRQNVCPHSPGAHIQTWRRILL